MSTPPEHPKKLIGSSHGGHAWDDRRPLTWDEKSRPISSFEGIVSVESVVCLTATPTLRMALLVSSSGSGRVMSTRIPTQSPIKSQHISSPPSVMHSVSSKKAYTHFPVHGSLSLRFSLSSFPSNLDYFVLWWIGYSLIFC